MAAQTTSTYNTLAWLGLFGVFFLIFVVCGVIGLCLLLCGAPTQSRAIVVGVLLCVALVALNLSLAFTASMHMLHPAGTVAMAVIVNFVSGPFIAVLFSVKYAVLFRHPPDVSNKKKVGDSDDDEGHGSDGADTKELAVNPGQNAPVEDVNELHIPRHRLTLIRDAILHSLLPQLAVTYGCMVLVIAVTHLVLADGCYCSSPNDFTTWASRSSTTPTCRRGEICHMYATVGSHCTDVVVVADFVAVDAAGEPTAAELEWWTSGSTVERAHAGVVSPSASFATQRTRGRIVVDHPIREDWRVVAQFPALGLRCGANYSFRLRFTRDGAAVADRTEVFATLPGAGAPVRFIGGGDLHGGAKGHNMMRRLWEQQRDSHFVWVGGDVAYANNIRYCYRRWDSTLALLAEPRRPDGSRPLLMAAVGNHEAGGYLTADADTRAGRAAAYTHYPTYFPSAEVLNDFVVFPGPLAVAGANGSTALVRDPSHPVLPAVTAAGLPAGHVGATFATTPGLRGDATVTFYRALIGSTAWIVLDSDVMFRTEAQLGYINETLALWSQLRAAGQLTKLVAAYHCPGLPTIRPLDNKQAVKVRRDFYPLLLRWNVSLVLEHHDHTYKRTHRMGVVREDGSGSTAAPGEGFLATGDGALGVGDTFFDAKHRWYHDVARNTNAGFAVEQSPSGYFSFRVFDENGHQFDAFEA